MAHTYFHDFTRESGEVVTVEYTFRPGSSTTYSPMYGADGGDADECEIVKAWVGETDVELPDDERERYETWIIENTDPLDYLFDE